MLHIYVNYSVKEIIQKIDDNIHNPEIDFLYETIKTYKANCEHKVALMLEQLRDKKPENAMRWIYENVDEAIRPYVIQGFREEPYNVLMRNQMRWKTISDIRIKVEKAPKQIVTYEDWRKVWESSIEKMKGYSLPFFETHAHYDLADYDNVRVPLLNDLCDTGVNQFIIPSIEFESAYRIKHCFDSSEFIRYAFGSHPKYIRKEMWTEDQWTEFSSLLNDPKCVAIGEVGLDYSYKDFNEEDRKMQMELFEKFITVANKKKLPMILHIRPSGDKQYLYNANEDTIQILRSNQIQYGAVLHCFGGTLDEVKKYLESGVTHFGIGGRIFSQSSEQLEKAIMCMPESSILLETDAPYMKVKKDKLPNTSFALVEIAEKIAQIRGTSVQHIILVAYKNSNRLFSNKKKEHIL